MSEQIEIDPKVFENWQTWRKNGRRMPRPAASTVTRPDPDKAAYADWLGELANLWKAYGKTPDPEQMSVYASVLGDVPLGLLRAAIVRVISTHEYNSVPTAAEVLRAVRAETGNDVNGVHRWHERTFSQTFYRFGG